MSVKTRGKKWLKMESLKGLPIDSNSDRASSVASNRRPLMAAVLGNAIEYYDHSLYGLFAAYLAVVFFDAANPTFAILATYATFISSYAVRPIAGLLLGRLADLRGHRFVLILTINLMTAGTFGIALIPGHNVIGLWSPVLLVICRLLQGVGASAEYTVATSYALSNSSAHRQQLIVGISNAATNIGPLLASLLALALTYSYGNTFLESGAWRIPFLLSAPVGLLVLYLRRKAFEDSPQEKKSELKQGTAHQPMFAALRGHWGMMARVIGLGAGQRVGTFCLQTYFVTALIRQGVDGPVAMFASILICVVGAPMSIFGGLLGDRLGGRSILITGYALYMAVTVPLFQMLGVSLSLSILGIGVYAVLNNVIAPALSHAYIMSFPPEVRGAASTLNFNVGTVLFGSTAPFVATWLLSYTGTEVAFGWYMTAFCAVSCATAIFAYPHSPKIQRNAH